MSIICGRFIRICESTSSVTQKMLNTTNKSNHPLNHRRVVDGYEIFIARPRKFFRQFSTSIFPHKFFSLVFFRGVSVSSLIIASIYYSHTHLWKVDRVSNRFNTFYYHLITLALRETVEPWEKPHSESIHSISYIQQNTMYVFVDKKSQLHEKKKQIHAFDAHVWK